MPGPSSAHGDAGAAALRHPDRLQGHLARAAHRLHRVVHEIQHRPLDLVGVHVHLRHVGGEAHLDVEGGVRLAVEDHHALEQASEVGGPGLKRGHAREAGELVHELLQPFHLLDDGGRRLPRADASPPGSGPWTGGGAGAGPRAG